ncbi:MAG: hypothetical protein ABL888_15110 [Pirellulaceae bacterium]
MNMQRSVKTLSREQPTFTQVTSPLITLFALPKPFVDPLTVRIQKNAIHSWTQLSPAVEVILFGDDYGIEEAADELGVRYGGPIRRNAFGTPLLSDAFRRVHELAESPSLMYTNSDVIFRNDLLEAAERILARDDFSQFVAFGQRHDLQIDRLLDLSQESDRIWLQQQLVATARRSPVVCKEYFLFPRGIYESIPDFAVGRGNWDNWMIYHARKREIPVINATRSIVALHQYHNYKHLKTSRLGCYVTCPEARENQRLAGGRHLVAGSCGTWRMTDEDIRPIPRAALNGDFWLNLSEFSRMILKMPFER